MNTLLNVCLAGLLCGTVFQATVNKAFTTPNPYGPISEQCRADTETTEEFSQCVGPRQDLSHLYK